MTDKEQIIIDGLNVLDTIDGWVNLVVNDRCTAEEAEIEYATAEVIQNYILDINKQLARKTQECEAYKKQLEFVRTHRTVIDAEKNRYRKALEEIEGIVSKDYYDDTWADISIKLDEILDIINKAKGEG